MSNVILMSFDGYLTVDSVASRGLIYLFYFIFFSFPIF